MYKNFQKRIGFSGDLKPLLAKAFNDYYNLGRYLSHTVIAMGYEDFNLIVETTSCKFFVKIFAQSRNDKECQRIIDVIMTARHLGADQPEIYPFNVDKFLYKSEIDGVPIRLCVMQYINGKTFFELRFKPTGKEAKIIIENAAKINSIDLNQSFIYDSWAIFNFLKEYSEKKQYLEADEKITMDKLAEEFSSVSIQDLPHCFVHGDLTKTNIMRDDSTEHLYILDYSVANQYPRIQELAVLLCDFLFDRNNLSDFNKIYDFTISEYQKYHKLEEIELKTLSLFVKLAHAMHVLRATYEKKVNYNQTEENEYFLNLGRVGLSYTTNLWK